MATTTKEKHKVMKYNDRTNIEGDIKPGIGHKLFEFNKKTGELQRVVLKKVPSTLYDRLMLRWFGMNTPYPNSYIFTALNTKTALKKMQERYSCNFIKVIELE